jgi:hypothetical protein
MVCRFVDRGVCVWWFSQCQCEPRAHGGKLQGRCHSQAHRACACVVRACLCVSSSQGNATLTDLHVGVDPSVEVPRRPSTEYVYVVGRRASTYAGCRLLTFAELKAQGADILAWHQRNQGFDVLETWANPHDTILFVADGHPQLNGGYLYHRQAAQLTGGSRYQVKTGSACWIAHCRIPKLGTGDTQLVYHSGTPQLPGLVCACLHCDLVVRQGRGALSVAPPRARAGTVSGRAGPGRHRCARGGGCLAGALGEGLVGVLSVSSFLSSSFSASLLGHPSPSTRVSLPIGCCRLPLN